MFNDDMAALVGQLKADFAPRAHLYAKAEELYAQRIAETEAKMAAMRMPELKPYARSVAYGAVVGLTVRKQYEDAVRAALMSQCADDSGYTAAAGYPVGRPRKF